jgi:hypothetical protein
MFAIFWIYQDKSFETSSSNRFLKNKNFTWKKKKYKITEIWTYDLPSTKPARWHCANNIVDIKLFFLRNLDRFVSTFLIFIKKIRRSGLHFFFFLRIYLVRHLGFLQRFSPTVFSLVMIIIAFGLSVTETGSVAT